MLSDPKYNGWGMRTEQGSSRKERTLRVMRKVVSSNSNALEFRWIQLTRCWSLASRSTCRLGTRCGPLSGDG